MIPNSFRVLCREVTCLPILMVKVSILCQDNRILWNLLEFGVASETQKYWKDGLKSWNFLPLKYRYRNTSVISKVTSCKMDPREQTSKILMKIETYLKILSPKCGPFCLSLNVLTNHIVNTYICSVVWAKPHIGFPSNTPRCAQLREQTPIEAETKCHICQTTFSNAFSEMKNVWISIKFHWINNILALV